MKNIRRKLVWSLAVVFVMMNVVSFMHAWRFTHFSNDENLRTTNPATLTIPDKIRIVLTGIDNPHPQHKSKPRVPFETITLQQGHTLSAWQMKATKPKGTVILFHGYCGERSALLERSYVFTEMGYNTVVVDFSGSGDSEGSGTSIGFSEAEEVEAWYRQVEASGEKNIVLFGTSMGAAAILKSIHDESFEPAAVILECPFGSLYKTVCARFHMMGIPAVPMAAMLSFWGGMQNGYWAFAHNPAAYAQEVKAPVLLLYGAQDERVSRAETEQIFENLPGKKKLIVYEHAGHDVFLPDNQEQWKRDVKDFVSGFQMSR